jgi:hypothetical protein
MRPCIMAFKVSNGGGEKGLIVFLTGLARGSIERSPRNCTGSSTLCCRPVNLQLVTGSECMVMIVSQL